jgi:hypothetical protein
MDRKGRTKGFFIAFDFTEDAKKGIANFRKRSGRVIIPSPSGKSWTRKRRCPRS